jgi:uncharacterized membrane protein
MKKIIIAISAMAILSVLLPVFAAENATVKTVEAVYLEKDKLKDKQVTVSGKVVKVNNGIMKRNFIHIADGTGSGDTSKIIVTSQQTAKVGDKVTATGIVHRGIDFGMGYSYDLLVEEATITPAK